MGEPVLAISCRWINIVKRFIEIASNLDCLTWRDLSPNHNSARTRLRVVLVTTFDQLVITTTTPSSIGCSSIGFTIAEDQAVGRPWIVQDGTIIRSKFPARWNGTCVLLTMAVFSGQALVSTVASGSGDIVKRCIVVVPVLDFAWCWWGWWWWARFGLWHHWLAIVRP